MIEGTSQNSVRDDARLCVAGLSYFEVFLPSRELDVSPGRERFVDHIGVGLGGVLNSASVTAALGIDTSVAHPRGEGLTDIAIAQRCQQMNITACHWPAADDPAISLVQSARGDRAFVSRADYPALEQCPPLLGFDWIHVPGLEEARRLGSRLAEARRQGATISACGSWAPDRLDELVDSEPGPWDLFVVNAQEARRAAPDCPSRRHRLRALSQVADSVIITDGPDTIHALLSGHYLTVDVPGVDRFVDATGAGDAFAAGFIAASLRELSPPDSLEFAVEVSRRIVCQHGGVVDQESALHALADRLSSNAPQKRENTP